MLQGWKCGWFIIECGVATSSPWKKGIFAPDVGVNAFCTLLLVCVILVVASKAYCFILDNCNSLLCPFLEKIAHQWIMHWKPCHVGHNTL